LALTLLALTSPPAALASPPVPDVEGTEIASAFDEGDPVDVFVTVNYAYEARRAAMKREATGRLPSTATDVPVPIVRDLIFKQNRHILTPRVAVGVFHDLELNAALPIVLSDTRTFSFDQTADPCVLPPDPDPTCINASNSTTLLDGILPSNATSMGYDADNPTVGFNPATDTMVFRGVDRSGLDQVHFGIAWAPLNQERDDTKPTWVIGAELRYSIGQIAKFNRMDPDAQNGVSSGVHQFRAYTTLSKRTTWSEPFVDFWWMAPVGYRGNDPPVPGSRYPTNKGTQFWDVGFGSESKEMQQQAGVHFGFEAIPWENPREQQRISLEFSGRVEAHFEGRGYSEMWEVFAHAGDPSINGPLVLDADPTTMAVEPLPHPGVTVIENYMTFAGRFGVHGQVGANAKFSASFEIANDQKHRITWTDAGEEGDDADDVITRGTAEVNPLHAPIVDVTGRNYIADDNMIYTFMVAGSVLF